MVPRTDQRYRLQLYLHGLLDGAEPKTAEAIAGRRAGPGGASGVAQSLQHFLGTSPWDSGRFLACYRGLLGAGPPGPPRTWVVRDLVVPKKGWHSVGAQRQFAKPLARKINCQVAVTLSEVRPGGCLPLAIRLYLPGCWLRDQRDLAERLVPGEHREHLRKPDIALRLIDELRAEGRCADFLTADPCILASQAFIEAVAQRGLQVIRPDEETSRASGGTRSAGELLVAPRREWEAKSSALADLCLAETDRRFAWLKQHLGLGQFEGRNWLGWHHHATLVLAAYGFLVTEQFGGRCPMFQ